MTRGYSVYSILLVLTRGRHLLLCQRHIGWISQIFPTPLSFSAFIRGDPLRIYGKALRFLKLESSTQPIVKIW